MCEPYHKYEAKIYTFRFVTSTQTNKRILEKKKINFNIVSYMFHFFFKFTKDMT